MTKTHVICARCGATNAMSAERDPRHAKCGKCAAQIFSGKPAEVDATRFARMTAHSDIPVLVDVWAPWCGPCRQMTPLFERAAAELEPHVQLVKLNADEAPEICARFGIKGIPALLLLSRGRLIAQSAGVIETQRIVQWTKTHLATLKETTHDHR